MKEVVLHQGIMHKADGQRAIRNSRGVNGPYFTEDSTGKDYQTATLV